MLPHLWQKFRYFFQALSVFQGILFCFQSTVTLGAQDLLHVLPTVLPFPRPSDGSVCGPGALNRELFQLTKSALTSRT